ncbi:MAG: hypothetical protein AAGA46_11625 [Cyanobacteria bacterium P01_F01_bin.13]
MGRIAQGKHCPDKLNANDTAVVVGCGIAAADQQLSGLVNHCKNKNIDPQSICGIS